MNWQSIIDDLNYNEEDSSYLKIMGSYENIFRILDRKGVLNRVDIGSEGGTYTWGNEFLLYLLNNKPEKFFEIYSKYSSEFEYEDGVPYLILNSLGDLSILFCERNNSSYVSEILKGDFYLEYSSHDLIDNMYTQIIEELTPENLNSLSKMIVNELSQTPIYPSTDLLESLSNEREEVYISDTNIIWIIKDEDTMNYLLEDYLMDLESELRSIYVSAYESAILSELHDSIWNELSPYFVNEVDYITIPHPYRKDTVQDKVKLKIWNFKSNIEEFLVNRHDMLLDYYYLDMLQVLPSFECLRVKEIDWADHKLLKSAINDYFKDYL